MYPALHHKPVPQKSLFHDPKQNKNNKDSCVFPLCNFITLNLKLETVLKKYWRHKEDTVVNYQCLGFLNIRECRAIKEKHKYEGKLIVTIATSF